MATQILDLSTLNQSGSFAATVRAESKISSQDAQAVYATLQVFHDCCLLEHPAFLASSLILIPSASKPSGTSQEFLGSLVRAAHRTSAALMCSSILAGRGSDSDDYGDIAFWVGKEGGAGGKEGILNALGLLGMVERGKIVSIPHEDGPLPAALAQIPPPELMSSDGISELSDLLSRLHDTFEFRVELPGSEGTVVHFLVGKAEDDGYCGLAGVGVWAGE